MEIFTSVKVSPKSLNYKRRNNMLGNWETKPYSCTHCNKKLEFRIAYKKVQFKNGLKWEEVSPSASIVLCPSCGYSFWIPQEIFTLSEVK